MFNATAHIPSDGFAEAISKVQEIWSSLPQRANTPDLSKHAVNACIGSMAAKDNTEIWQCLSSRTEEDISKVTDGVGAGAHERRATLPY